MELLLDLSYLACNALILVLLDLLHVLTTSPSVLYLTTRYRELSLAALSLFALGTGHMIEFRHSYTHIGYIIIAQVYFCCGGHFNHNAIYFSYRINRQP